MNITVANNRFLPRHVITESEIDQRIDDIFVLLESAQADSDLYQMMTNHDTLDDYYTEDGTQKVKKGLFDKIGEAVVSAINGLIELLNKITGKKKEDDWADKTDMDKIQAVCDKYPVFKDQMIALINEGAIDMSSIRDMSDFITQFDKLKQMTENPTEDLTGLKKVIKDIGQKLGEFNEEGAGKALAESGKVMKSINTFGKEGQKLKLTCDNIRKKVQEFLDWMGSSIISLPDKIGRALAALIYSPNKLEEIKKIFTESAEHDDYGFLDFSLVIEASETVTDGAQQVEANPEETRPLIDMLTSKIMGAITDIYGKITRFLNDMVHRVTKTEVNYAEIRRDLANTMIDTSKIIEHNGGMEKTVEGVTAGRIKLPKNVQMAGSRIIIDVSKYNKKGKDGK